MALIGINGKIGSGKDTCGKIIQYFTWCENPYSTDLSAMEPWLQSYTTPGALYTLPHQNWEIKKYAAKLKQVVALLTGCTVEQLEDQEFKKTHLGPEWDYVYTYGSRPASPSTYENDEIYKADPERFRKKYTYREILQFVGTNAMREVIHENIWVNALFADYKDLRTTYPDGRKYMVRRASAVYDQAKGKFVVPAVSYIPEKSHGLEVEQERIQWHELSEEPVYPDWIITDMRFPNEMRAVKERGGITIRVNRPGVVLMNHPSETALDNAEFDYVIDNNGSLYDLVLKVREILIKENLLNAEKKEG